MSQPFDFADDSDYDLQHDLALALAHGESDDLTDAQRNELLRRNACLPVNCRFVHNPYAACRKDLRFELKRAA